MKSSSSESAQAAEATVAPPRLLDEIRSPADIKALREQDLPQLAQEVREELISVLSQTGGHLGPNLGVVELTIALHRVFNTPHDRFVMDVSHQGYVHKLFTGRLDRFDTMRQYRRAQWLPSAHRERTRLLRRRSCGHGALRRAGHGGGARPPRWRRERYRRSGRCRFYMRDQLRSAQQCQSAHQAFHRRAERQRVVDRKERWGDRKLSEHHRDQPDLRASARESAPFRARRLPANRLLISPIRSRKALKGLLVPSVIFEELGLRYYGPIDGHDIPLLIRTFEFLKTQEEPVLLHILTQKGQGIRAGPQATGQVPWSRQIQDRERRDRADADAYLFGDFRQDAGEIRGYESETRCHYRRRCRAGRVFRISLRRTSRPLFRCRHRRGARHAFCLRAGDTGVATVPRDLLHLFAARLRHGRFTISRMQNLNVNCAWTALD